MPRAGIVLVAGDVTVDWNLARTKGGSAHASFELGGAARLAELATALASDLSKAGDEAIEVRALGMPAHPVAASDDRFHRSYALWSRYETPSGGGAWRVEEWLGSEQAVANSDPLADAADHSNPDLMILHDAGLGFRDQSETWPRALGASDSWVILEMASPVGKAALWERLQPLADRLIVIVRVDDLRLSEVSISRELSWERTAQDLTWELLYNHRINALARCAHVVVSFSTAGALLVSNTGRPADARLVFDPRVMEDMWNEAHPGKMVGYTGCLTAGIARQVIVDPSSPDLELGIQRGIAAMRALHLHGYDFQDGTGLRFPHDRIVDELGKAEAPFATTAVSDPLVIAQSAEGEDKTGRSRGWTILRDRYRDSLERLAERIVIEGTEVLDGVPIGEFGKLVTVDRREIEGFRSIRTLIREYERQSRHDRPLSIAVFGPPGSGKSFGVKQVAESVLPKRIKVLTFNLSQFDDADEVIDALHQVRDASLSGFLPLVFWDEFDSALGGQPLGWLRHFLSPMQDGAFQDGQVVHPIGPAVFVFAGGTSSRMRDFSEIHSAYFKNAKGPDFVSRLKGYVDVLGPDPANGDPAADPYYLVRRAILLRTLLLISADHIFKAGRPDIDAGVLRAFLRTWTYRHGARSMESLVAMSSLSGKSRFERSSLPAEAQLDLHVDAEDFLDLVQLLELEGELLDRLAEANHVVFCESRLRDGMSWGEPDDGYLERHEALEPFVGRGFDPGSTQPTLVSYESLAEEDKEQNRSLVRDIPNKLAAAGLAMRPAREGDPPAELSRDQTELLAEHEHDRWMRTKLRAKWSWGPERNDDLRTHPDLLPWSKTTAQEAVDRFGAELASRIGEEPLPEDRKAIDRELIDGIPPVLAVAGYTIAEVRSDQR